MTYHYVYDYRSELLTVILWLFLVIVNILVFYWLIIAIYNICQLLLSKFKEKQNIAYIHDIWLLMVNGIKIYKKGK